MKSITFITSMTICVFGVLRLRHVTLSPLPPGPSATPAKRIDFNYFEPVKVFSPPKRGRNETVAICLIVRNETVYLDEWVDFHVSLGFAPIWIYDNADVQDLELQAWHARRSDIQSVVHIVHMPLFPVQGHAYEACLRRDAKDSTFAAMIDVDEFVVLKEHDNIVDMMVELCDEDCGQLTLNWNLMGTSNVAQYSPMPVTKRNLHAITKRLDASRAVKAIVRPSYVADEMDWSHTVMLKKGQWYDTNGATGRIRIKSTTRGVNPYEHDGPRDVGLLYHYKYKSEEEWYLKSCVRGHALFARGDMRKCNDLERSGNANRAGDDLDEGAWKQLLRMVPKYARFG
mmetsp:Transcript_20459/g.48052  ORF Transcript_20459/g.48052 Transcript_20459/m.48052 type:complete len:342 (-) Transcript_20459:53-1078(-)